jgi:endonuclease V-like protein UPF0215 family
MHLGKKGIRILGIAESFSSRERSLIAGVVMRKDLRIDGVAFGTVTVGGLDASDCIINAFFSLDRRDIQCIMVSGCIISWYNIIDLKYISEKTGLPVIAVTYEESEGLEDHIRHHFPGDEERLRLYRNLGERIPVCLSTGYTAYIRSYGIEEDVACALVKQFTLDGKIPEPLRVARIIARSAMHYTKNLKEEHLAS